MIGAPYRMSEAFESSVRVGCKFDGCDERSVVNWPRYTCIRRVF